MNVLNFDLKQMFMHRLIKTFDKPIWLRLQSATGQVINEIELENGIS